MPNWCDNEINITSTNKASVKNLYHLLKEWTSKTAAENSWGNIWLGNIVEFSGIDNTVSCRGCVNALDMHNDTIILHTESAWAPALTMWKLVCDKYLGEDYKLHYVSVEPGEGIYCTNDPTLADKYIIDVWEDNEWIEESCYEATEDYVRQKLQCMLDTDEENIDSLIEMLYEMDEPPFSINKLDYVDLDEWE